MMRRLRAMRQTITVVRAGVETGEEDAYGQPLLSDPSRITVTGVSLQPSSSAENQTPQADSVTTGWRLYCPPGTDLRAGDLVQQHRDRVSPVTSDAEADRCFDVDGDAAVWELTGGSLDHVEATLKVREG